MMRDFPGLSVSFSPTLYDGVSRGKVLPGSPSVMAR